MDFLTRALRRVISAYTAVAITAVILMMLHITFDVALKFFLGWSPPGTITMVSTYYMVAVAFLPLAMVEFRDAHIAVDVVSEHFPPRLQSITRTIGFALSLAVFGVVAATSGQMAVEKMRIGAFVMESSTAIPVWPSYFLLPLGAGLMCLVLLLRLFAALTGQVQPGDNPSAEHDIVSESAS